VLNACVCSTPPSWGDSTKDEQKFSPHLDGYFVRDSGETEPRDVHGLPERDVQWGRDEVLRRRSRAAHHLRPEQGMALAFVHLQLHEGAPVIAGRKYVLRTDVMYSIGDLHYGR
jgi:hypothetical protein